MNDESPEITELDNLTKLLTSNEWFEALKVIKAHKEFLQKEVNRHVKEQKLIEAYGALSKLEDADKIFKMIKERHDILRKEK